MFYSEKVVRRQRKLINVRLRLPFHVGKFDVSSSIIDVMILPLIRWKPFRKKIKYKQDCVISAAGGQVKLV